MLIGAHGIEAHSEGSARTETTSRRGVCSRGLNEAQGTGAGSEANLVREEVGEVAGWGKEGLGGSSKEWAFIL